MVPRSAANRTRHRRIGFAIATSRPTCARPRCATRDAGAGTDKHRHFDYEARPKADLDEAALAAHADSVARQVKALYQGTEKTAFRA